VQEQVAAAKPAAPVREAAAGLLCTSSALKLTAKRRRKQDTNGGEWVAISLRLSGPGGKGANSRQIAGCPRERGDQVRLGRALQMLEGVRRQVGRDKLSVKIPS